MPDEQDTVFDLSWEVDRLFDESSLSHDQEPEIVLIMGGPAAGKTTIRKKRYAKGFVLVDSADIFLSLSRGKYYPFPEEFEEPMEWIGQFVAARAIEERRHIVTELIGGEIEPMKQLIGAMRAIGYRVKVEAITCDFEQAVKWNLNRGDDDISAHFAERFQRRWLIEAAEAALAAKPESA